MLRGFRRAGLPIAVLLIVGGLAVASARPLARPADAEADTLYRGRADLDSARRAADLWEASAGDDFESAWKLARVCYWIGTHGTRDERRDALERGVKGGEGAIRLGPDRPEGHFWLAANMGALAQSFGLGQGLKYRGRIKSELERVLAIAPGWQEGSAEDALGEWYDHVPGLFGGSDKKAEEYYRKALGINPQSRTALTDLADLLIQHGHAGEARPLLERAIDAPIDPDWAPEDEALKAQATRRLETLEQKTK